MVFLQAACDGEQIPADLCNVVKVLLSHSMGSRQVPPVQENNETDGGGLFQEPSPTPEEGFSDEETGQLFTSSSGLP